MRLPFHLVKLIAEHFKGDRAVTDLFQDLPRKAFVVGNARFAHQGRVGRKPFDVAQLGKAQNTFQVSAICE